MPHVSSSGGGDDLGSEDEVKVFKDEGEDEKRSSENLTEEKSSLIDLTESEVRVDEIKKFSLFFSSTLSYNRYRVVVTIEFYLCITQRVILLSLSFSLFLFDHRVQRIFFFDPPTRSWQHKDVAIKCMRVFTGKGLARRWKLRDDGQDVSEIRPQPRFRWVLFIVSFFLVVYAKELYRWSSPSVTIVSR